MDFDISHLLEKWEYQPGHIVVRRFKAKDGTEKIQLRVNLGLMQMNAEGRPDGKRPFGYPSLLEYYQARLYKHVAEHEGSDDGFALKREDCTKLQLEALQYHHRCFCLLQLEDYPAVIRDAERNLVIAEFVTKHVASPDLAWSVLQFQPQLLTVLTRARGAQALQAGDYPLAIQLVEEGIEKIRTFCNEASPSDAPNESVEELSLEEWLEEIRAKRPLSKRERLEDALREAVKTEDYERAAQVRDQLRSLPAGE
jgi:UvrB/UvrC motif-containing protein